MKFRSPRPRLTRRNVRLAQGWEALEDRRLLAGMDPSFLPEELSELVRTSPAVVGSESYDGGSAFDPRDAELPLLSSKPGATRTIFLDFDGHVVTGTPWNSYNNGLPIHAPAYSADGNIFAFSISDAANITQIYRRVAEDFAPFDVNVTTQDPGPAAFTFGGRAIRALVSTDVDDSRIGGTGNTWFSGAGGVAFLNSWNWTDGSPVWVFENNLGNGNPRFTAEATSHEVGHALSLNHDGTTSGVEYYSGHGPTSTGWAPIMGVGYDRPVTQWSKGEYAAANNLEDDLAAIAIRIPYRGDDHASAKTNAATATAVAINGQDFSASGIIERRTDVDVFRFEVAARRRLNLNVTPNQVGANLDILAELYGPGGQLIAAIDPVNQLAVSLAIDLDPGTYTLAIDGVGNGNPLNSGYSDYGSLGQFNVAGTLSEIDPFPGGAYVNAAPVLDHPTAPSNMTFTFSEPIDPASVDLLADVFLQGPNSSDLTALVNSVAFPNPHELRLNFVAPLSIIPGDYELRLGPGILDGTGTAMDQDRDGTAGEPAQDQFVFAFTTTSGLRGDFNTDQVVNDLDIDLLAAAIRNAGSVATYDLNADSLLNQLDFDEMIRGVLGTEYGDANLDRVVDGSDFNLWNAHKFQNGGWADGDFNGDATIDGSDFNLWNAHKFTGTFARVKSSGNDRDERQIVPGLSVSSPAPARPRYRGRSFLSPRFES